MAKQEVSVEMSNIGEYDLHEWTALTSTPLGVGSHGVRVVRAVGFFNFRFWTSDCRDNAFRLCLVCQIETENPKLKSPRLASLSVATDGLLKREQNFANGSDHNVNQTTNLEPRK